MQVHEYFIRVTMTSCVASSVYLCKKLLAGHCGRDKQNKGEGEDEVVY